MRAVHHGDLSVAVAKVFINIWLFQEARIRGFVFSFDHSKRMGR